MEHIFRNLHCKIGNLEGVNAAVETFDSFGSESARGGRAEWFCQSIGLVSTCLNFDSFLLPLEYTHFVLPRVCFCISAGWLPGS